MTFGRPIPLEETLARRDAVKAADIRKIAGEVFLASAPTLAAIGPLDGLIRRDEITEQMVQTAVLPHGEEDDETEAPTPDPGAAQR